MTNQLILSLTDTRQSLPQHFEYVLFAKLEDGKIMYGAWHQAHRRFYTPGGYYDLADVKCWARIPPSIQEDEPSVHS